MKPIRYFLTHCFYLLGGITWSLIEIFDPEYGYYVYKYFMVKSGDFDTDQWLWENCE